MDDEVEDAQAILVGENAKEIGPLFHETLLICDSWHMIGDAQAVFNLCGLDSPQFANIVIPAHAGIQWFVRGHRLSPV